MGGQAVVISSGGLFASPTTQEPLAVRSSPPLRAGLLVVVLTTLLPAPLRARQPIPAPGLRPRDPRGNVPRLCYRRRPSR